MTFRVLMVEDTMSLARMYAAHLEDQGFDVTIASDGSSGIAMCRRFDFDAVLLDLKLPDKDGIEVLERLRAEKIYAGPVIIITGHGSVSAAVQAMRSGASDFLLKPFPIQRLSETIRRAVPQDGGASMTREPPRGLSETVHAPYSPAPESGGFDGFLGTSAAMMQIYQTIESAARSRAPVFITGETGTGKDLCAEAIHHFSPRKDKPFVAINCAAIPRDLLESEFFGHARGAFTGALSDHQGAIARAEGGTLFLDEICELALDMQTKLLRFLQNLTYTRVGGSKTETADVRIVCATNRDPVSMVETGHFRQDLYYRLFVLPIHMPPLRQRGDDVLDIAQMLVRRYAGEEGKTFHKLGADAQEWLCAYSWPGNIRQLQNILRNIVVLEHGDTITARMLQHALPVTVPAPMPGAGEQAVLSRMSAESGIRPLWQVEKEAIEAAIDKCRGNIPQAAALLGISPSTIYRKKQGWEEEQNGNAA